MSKLAFNANKVAPQQSMEAIPAESCGWMKAVVRQSEIVPTKTSPKDGTLLELTFEIIEGDFKGRRVWERINIKNKNPVAEEIGQGQLSALCHGTGVLVIADTTQLHDKPLEIRVGYEGPRDVGDKHYEGRNNVKGYRPVEGTVAPMAGKTAAPAWAKSADPTPDPEPTPEATPEAAGVEEGTLLWVVLDGETVEKSATELQELLDARKDIDTVMIQEDQPGHTGEWAHPQTLGFTVPAPVAKAPPAKAPPAKPAPAPAAKPAAPTAPKAGNTPPWAKK